MAQNLDLKKLLPNYLKNETLTGLVDNLFNRFLSKESSLFVAGTVGLPQSGKNEIEQSSLERQENDLIPGLFFSSGKEEYVYTFEDFINKMKILDVDQIRLREWMAEQTFNYAPPINLDKFINFSNYYWIGKFVGEGQMPWNVESDPEYYVIRRPLPADARYKMPVRLATTRNINLWINDRPREKITLEFTSANTFEVTSSLDVFVRAKDSVGQPSNPISSAAGDNTVVILEARNTLTSPTIRDPNLSQTAYYDLVELTIVNGNIPFAIGDTIEIELTHYTSQYTVAVNGLSVVGKGTAVGITTLSPVMFIDGVQVNVGDRILVKEQTDPTENGIYIVSSGSKWERSFDATLNEHFSVGQKVTVLEGVANANRTFEILTIVGATTPEAEVDGAIDYYLPVDESNVTVNDWQFYNFWIHRDDLYRYESIGVNTNTAIQAQRPIIEYNNTLELNSAVDVDGNACAVDAPGAIVYEQSKTRFNQIPQFDLYRYDGTHAGKTSGIWFYEEAASEPVDPILKRRAKTTTNFDFVFGMGLIDEFGRQLYFKDSGELTSIWQAGPNSPVASTPIFSGATHPASNLEISNLNVSADNQEWTVEIVSTTEAKVTGSRSGTVGVLPIVASSAGSSTAFEDFSLKLFDDGINFIVGDTFTFRVLNKSAPRYIKSEDGEIINFPAGAFESGYEADMNQVEPSGAWLTPVRMFQNMNRETRQTIAFGDFLSHARAILRKQDGFEGSSFGNNNSRQLEIDPGLGGQIREYGSNFPLLASMLIQQDISPITIIDFVEQQYNLAISSIDQFILSEFVNWISTGTTDISVASLVEKFKQFRRENALLSQTFADTTAKVPNWPATLPMLGIVPKVQPELTTDISTGDAIIVHHDGHTSPAALSDAAFNSELVNTRVLRSDGTVSAGSISTTEPVQPYARQLWLDPNTNVLKVFNVNYDGTSAPNGETGQYWYDRSISALYEWDSSTLTWATSSDTVTSRWTDVLPENDRNNLVLQIEQELYDSVHDYQQITYDALAVSLLPQAQQYNALELARFGAKYNVDPFGEFQYGDNGPVEVVWRNSLEFRYGAARTAFRLDPLGFLDKVWGETYTTAANSRNSNLRVERNLQTSLSHKDFLLHGERLHSPTNITDPQKNIVLNSTTGAITWTSSFSGNVEFRVTHVANSNDLAANDPGATVFSVYLDGVHQMDVLEGQEFSFASGGVTFTDVTIEDFGIPFNLGDSFKVSFRENQITETIITEGTDFVYGILGCQGCAADLTPDPFEIIEEIEFPPVYTFTPANVKVLNGVGQWFTNLLRFTSIDETSSLPILAFRDWEMKLVHRFGALIRPDSLSVEGPLGKIPDTGYNVLLKKAYQSEDFWISGLRIQRVGVGIDNATNQYGRLIPATDGHDWVFRIENYNSAHPIADIDVLDTSGDYVTFYALNKARCPVEWKRYTSKTATSTVTLPVQITGIQNVLNFVFGYVSQLEENNFKINETDMPLTDALTGRNIDWQLEVEKFIDTLYSGIETNEAIILNPFMDKLFLQTPEGLLSKFDDAKFLDPSTTQACYDVTGAVIPVRELSVVRRDDQSIVYSKTPIFSAHLFLDRYEHALLLNQRFSDDPTSEISFDSFLGQYIPSAYLSFYRQENANGKPIFDGYVLSGNNVKRNIISNIDTVQNAYDVNKTFAEPKMAEHATALVGFQPKEYFSEIDINPTAQLDFWRGMISAKGTTLAVDAFTQYKSFTRAAVDELWAFKVAEYGDARERSLPEIKINPNDCFRQFTSLQFYSKDDPSYSVLPLYTQIEANDDDRWFSLKELGTTLRFDGVETSEQLFVSEPGYYKLSHVYHNGDAFAPSIVEENTTDANGARIINATTVYIQNPGIYVVRGFTWNNEAKLSPVKLFDYSANELEAEIGLWHPAANIHNYQALGLVNITSASDPANYNYSTQTVDNPNLMNLKPWAGTEVGRVWWNTSNLAYVPYYDATVFLNRETRQSRWGSLSEWASVDLYEWTESPVHPSEYDALAKSQEGDSSIDAKVRLSGRVAQKEVYAATRSVSVRAIAWSQAGQANGNAHPAFGLAADKTVYRSNNQLIIDEGRLADVQLTPGRRFGGWDILNSRPVGEVQLGSNVSYIIGAYIPPEDALNTNYLSEPIIELPDYSSAVTGDPEFGVNITAINVTPRGANGIFGTRIGQISLTSYRVITNNSEEPAQWFVRMQDDSGFFEDVYIQPWTTSRLVSGDTRHIDFETFGLRISVSATSTAGLILPSVLAAAIGNPLHDIYIREGVNYTEIVPLTEDIFSNRSVFGIAPSSMPEYGWKAWDIPTAAQLKADLPAPRNKWRPYLGTPVAISNVTADIVADMKSATNKFVLSNGIEITRYQSEWSEWVTVKDTKLTSISDGQNAASFNVNTEDVEIDKNRLSIYVNGIQVAPNEIVVDGQSVGLTTVLPEGHEIYLLYRAYQPTAAELSFNPEVEDDPQIQTWYKQDYQYTKVNTRDSSGNIAGSKYYFWVKDKTVAKPDQSMSLAQATQLLVNGDPLYMIFSRMVADANATGGAAFDSCAISGLGTFVTKNDSYKLRFLRDFTLRHDPEELKLKNTHTEWALIREKQNVKIPRKLWDALTNAICGQDAIGNVLPSEARVKYDEKHGTRFRYGFESGQIFVDPDLALQTTLFTILNTSLNIELGTQTIVDYINFMGINSSTTEESLRETWFTDADKSRETMNRIFESARAQQVNEIFFRVLDDALSNNYEFEDLFKTSFITINSASAITPEVQLEQRDEYY